MSWFSRLRNWQQDASNGIGIRADYHDQEDDNFASGINNCINIAGQNSPTSNIPFNSFRITGIGDGVSAQDSVSFKQSQIQTASYSVDASGTDTYAVSPSPAITQYTAGMVIRFKAATANTGAATINVSTLGAKSIVKQGGAALSDNEIIANQIVELIYDGTNFVMMSQPYGSMTQTGQTIYAADSVGTDAYAITLSPPIQSYMAGMVFNFKAGTANTGAATINVNSLGNKTIKKLVSNDLATGDILANQIVSICYDGTNFQMLSYVDDIINLTTDSSPDLAADYVKTWDASASTYKKVLLQNAMQQIVASQAEMEAGSSNTVFVTPGRFKYHPGSSKGWGMIGMDGTTLPASYNIASLTDSGLGDTTISWTTSFSSNNYCAVPNVMANGGLNIFAYVVDGMLAGSVRIITRTTAGVPIDPSYIMLTTFGDQ